MFVEFEVLMTHKVQVSWFITLPQGIHKPVILTATALIAANVSLGSDL